MEKPFEETLVAPGHRACAGCGCILAMRLALQALGKNVIVSMATGCMEVVTTPYPETAWRVPWIHAAFENAAAVASGVEAGLKSLGKSGIKSVAIAGDGGTADIGLQALSGAIERGHDFLYICYDNEAYMNCLPASSLIMTEKGIKKIIDVKLGERVYAFDQKTGGLTLKTCTAVFDNGARPILELYTMHHQIRATPNHPFLVLKRNGRGKENELVWKPLSEVKPRDMVVTLKDLGEGRPHRFDPTEKKTIGDYKVTHVNEVNIPEVSSPGLMKYLGIYLGDGWIRQGRGEIGFALPDETPEREELINLHSTIFGDHIREDDMYVYVNSVNLSTFIQNMGFGSGAKNKTIPSWIFTLPRTEKEAFVEGLLLSDGYRTGNSFRYVSASEDLLVRLRLLLQTMGYRVGKIHKQRKEKGTLCAGRKLLKDAEWGYIAFSKRHEKMVNKYPSQYRYHDFLVQSKHFEMEEVTDIKVSGGERVFDLHVEGEHNFIADGIVVHNTGVQRSGLTPFGAWTTTTPIGKVKRGEDRPKKDLPAIIAAHGAPYVATASVAYPVDYMNKLKKAAAIHGPTYVQVHAPCTPGWRIDNNKTIEVARLAVLTGAWILYEVENGKLNVTLKPPKRRPVADYLKMQGRFKHLTEAEIAEIQRMVDEQCKRFGI